jgi:RecA-family ATPase
MNAPDFAKLIEPVARKLLGPPNAALSKNGTLRWGTHGSFKVDLDPGCWHDKEADEGGGALDLIMREQRCNKSGALEWLEREGLIEPRQTADPRRAQPRASKSTFYDYADEQGEVRYRVERIETGADRDFRQHGPDGRGGFHSARGCMSGVVPLPYRLPELLAADSSRLVYVCAGEKDADRLASVGLVATSNSGGEGNWRPELNRWLSGRRCVLLEDNDRKGRDHVAKLRAHLEPVASAAAVLRLPDLPEKGDVSDWLDAGNNLADLERLAEAVVAAAQPADPIGEMCSVASTAGTEPQPRRWIIDQLVPVGAVTTLFGDGGVGKTLTAMQMGVAVDQGDEIFGFATTRSPVLGFFCEDEQRELERRFHAICRVSGVDQAKVQSFLYQSRFGRESLLGAFGPTGSFDGSALLAAIREMAIDKGARTVMLDNILHLYPGNINDPGEVTRFLASLNRLALDIDGAVLLLGHIAKSQGSQFAGTMAWSNASRSRLYFGRPGDLESFGTDEEATAGRDPDERIIARLKANYAPISDPITLRYFEGAFIRPDDMPANARVEMAANAQANAENERFLACLAARTEQERAVSDSNRAGKNTYAPTAFAAMTEAKGMKPAQFARAMERLFHIKVIEKGELPFEKSRGHKAIGLRLRARGSGEKAASHIASGTCAPVRPGSSQVVDIPSAPVGRAHTHISKDIYGAASAAAPPSDDRPSRRDRPPILARRDDDDEPFSRPTLGAPLF